MWERSVAGAAGQAARNAALFGDGVKLARVAKDDLGAVRRRKAKEPAGIGEILSRSESVGYQDEEEDEYEAE